jgi:hypothetical protein
LSANFTLIIVNVRFEEHPLSRLNLQAGACLLFIEMIDHRNRLTATVYDTSLRHFGFLFLFSLRTKAQQASTGSATLT